MEVVFKDGDLVVVFVSQAELETLKAQSDLTVIDEAGTSFNAASRSPAKAAEPAPSRPRWFERLDPQRLKAAEARDAARLRRDIKNRILGNAGRERERDPF